MKTCANCKPVIELIAEMKMAWPPVIELCQEHAQLEQLKARVEELEQENAELKLKYCAELTATDELETKCDMYYAESASCCEELDTVRTERDRLPEAAKSMFGADQCGKVIPHSHLCVNRGAAEELRAAIRER